MKPNFWVLPHKLMRYRQEAYTFLKRIQQQIKLCEYDQEYQEMMLVDHFILRLHLKSTQKARLREGRALIIASVLKGAETDKAITRQVVAIHAPTKTIITHSIKTKAWKNEVSVVQITRQDNVQQWVKHAESARKSATLHVHVFQAEKRMDMKISKKLPWYKREKDKKWQNIIYGHATKQQCWWIYQWHVFSCDGKKTLTEKSFLIVQKRQT